MNHVKSLNVLGLDMRQLPCFPGKGAPTTSTVGAVGELYMDTDTGKTYKCIAAEGGVYTWIAGIDERDIKDTVADTTLWSSRKTAREIFCVSMDVPWEKGGLQSNDGTNNDLTNRMRTGYIDVTKPYLFVDFDESVQLYAYFYSGETYRDYISSCGAWLTSPFILSDIMPGGTKFVRFGAKLASNEDIEDVNIASSCIDIRTMRGVISDPYSEYQSDVPESIGVLNTVLNFKQLTDISYTTKANLPSQAGDFAAGYAYKGLPYSSSRPEAGFVPNFISLHTFMTALQNPNSYLYTVDLGEQGNENGDTYYGAVCSTSCGYALGIVPNYTTHQWKDVPGMDALEWQSVYGLKIGDTISSRLSGHVVMVTDITRNKRGRIGEITITEAVAPRVLSTKYTPETLEERFPPADYVYFRYSKIHEVKHIQSPFVAVEDEVPQTVTYNTAIIPRKGDKANWLSGVPVEVDILDPGSYTDAEIYKDDAPFRTISLSGGEIIPVDRTVYGIPWEIGGLQSADGTWNDLNTRAKARYIPSTDLEVTVQDGVKVSLFFYDTANVYISASGFVENTGVISVKDYAPENAGFVSLVIANNDNSVIDDLDAITAKVAVSASAESNTLPVVIESGGLYSKDGSEIQNGSRFRSGFIPLQNLKVSVSNDVNCNIYYYDADKEFISYTGGWLTDETALLTAAPEGTAYIRFVMKRTDDAAVDLDSARLYGLKITLTILGDMTTETGERVDVLNLTDLTYGSYKARLTDGTNHSDWCYWMVVDAVSTATPTGNAGEASVAFSASNAMPLFVAWSHGTNNGTVHISIPTDEELAAGSAVCSYQAGKYKVRVAFQTEYGIIHSELPAEITV